MEEPGTVYFTGTAGAGKSTFVRRIRRMDAERRV